MTQSYKVLKDKAEKLAEVFGYDINIFMGHFSFSVPSVEWFLYNQFMTRNYKGTFDGQIQ